MNRFLVTLLVILAPSIALAQEFIDAESCVPYDPFRAGVPYGVALQGRQTAMRTFGVSQFADRALAPLLENGPAVFSFHTNAIFDSAHVPGIASNPACPSIDRYQRTPVDAAAGNIGFGFGTKWMSVFYAGNTTRVTLRADDTSAGFGPYRAAFGSVTGLAAPFLGTGGVDGLEAHTRDYIVGGRLAVPVPKTFFKNILGSGYAQTIDALPETLADIKLGYIGSKGIYTSVDVPAVKLFSAASISQDFSVLSYLRAGVGPYNVNEILDGAGSTLIYAQEAIFTSPFRVDPQSGVLIDDPQVRTPFWTVNLQQRQIIGNFDLTVSVGVAPQAFLHQVKVGWNSGGFHDEEPVGAQSRYGPGWADFRVAVGFIEMPELRFLGVRGGKKRPTVDLEGRIIIGQRKKEGALVLGWSFKANDPDVLMLFPTSASATHFLFLEMQIGAFERKDAKG